MSAIGQKPLIKLDLTIKTQRGKFTGAHVRFHNAEILKAHGLALLI